MKKYFKYKGVTVNAFGLPVLFTDKDKPVESKKSSRNYFQYRLFDYHFPLTAPKDLIVAYDIPSNRRSERDWLRRQLKGFNYTMLQKNVWVGPSPLPPDFLDYVKSVGLLNQLKILKLAQPFSK
jgi:hypothetical protein